MSGGKPAASALAFAVNAMLTFHHMINIFWEVNLIVSRKGKGTENCLPIAIVHA